MKPYLIATLGVIITCFALTLIFLTHGSAFPVLSPSGSIALLERDLMFRATFLMLIVVIPVIILAIFIAWHYRESNTKAVYTPDWEQSRMEELIWWSIPFEIVLVLSALTWGATHELDPSRTLPSTNPPLVVEVVALPWKWLFIYPEQGVASVNELALPVGRAVAFHITADAPMNSFWIPALGGQMYAMTDMETVLNLSTDKTGEYEGRSANYSGIGFSQMTFTTRVMSESDYQGWVAGAKQSTEVLSPDSYQTLRQPSEAGPARYYGIVRMRLSDIVNSFMPGMHAQQPESNEPSTLAPMHPMVMPMQI